MSPRRPNRPSCLQRLFRLLPLPFVWSACGAGGEVNWPDTLDLVHSTFPEVAQLQTVELSHWLSDPERTPPLLLDAREPDEYAVSHLPGARRISPDASDLDLVIRNLDPGQPIVVYCSVGYRSSKIARQLGNRGFANVHNLDGSIFAWANEDRPLESNGRPTAAVHPYNEEWGVLLDKSRHPTTDL